MTDALHIRGRWVTMLTASRCVHHVSLADSCAPCGETGLLSDFSDEVLLAECVRRGLDTDEIPDAPFVPLTQEERAAIIAKGGTDATLLQHSEDFKRLYGSDLAARVLPTTDVVMSAAALKSAKSAPVPTPPERPAKKGRK